MSSMHELFLSFRISSCCDASLILNELQFFLVVFHEYLQCSTSHLFFSLFVLLCYRKGYVRVMNYFYFFVCILFLALLVAFVIVNKQPVEEAVAMPTEVDTCIKPDNSSQVNCSVPVSTRSHLWIHLKVRKELG